MLQDQIKATACAGEMRLLYGRVGKKIHFKFKKSLFASKIKTVTTLKNDVNTDSFE